MLQEAWFKVRNIPTDQRSIRTIAKIGGLVGKVMEIDNTIRFSHDYVRMRIARMDVTKVPRTATSTLGMFIHEFIYEREVLVEEGEKTLKSGIKVGDKQQPSPKKSKPNDQAAPGSNTSHGERSSRKFSRMGAGRDNSQSQSEKVMASAPPKMGSGKTIGTKLMGDAQKAFKQQINVSDNEDRVQIPDNFEESDTESDTFSEKLRKIDADDIGQGCSKDMAGEVNKRVWRFETDPSFVNPIKSGVEQQPGKPKSTATEVGIEKEKSSDDIFIPMFDSPGVFISDDQIVNTQGSAAEEVKP
jgi:hypothetical protein